MRRALLGSLVVVLLAAAVPASATTTIAWTHQFGSSEYDVAWGIAVSGTDAYVAGWTLGALPGQTNAGGADAFLRRLDGDDAGDRVLRGKVDRGVQFGLDQAPPMIDQLAMFGRDGDAEDGASSLADVAQRVEDSDFHCAPSPSGRSA